MKSAELKGREARQEEELDSTEWERMQLIDKVEKLETRLKALEGKMNDLETRGERKSLAVVGMLSLLILRMIYGLEKRP
jgi:uncharacterized protein YlxW (UPF0749 family)